MKAPEPGYSSGWGFCSSEEDQLQCDSVADKKLKNTAKLLVSQFDRQFCTEKLAKNLQADHMRLDTVASVSEENMFCGGKNVTADWENVEAYTFDAKSGIFQLHRLDELAVRTLANANVSKYEVDGVACQGDAGAPLFKYVDHRGVQKPVLVGLFSFLLWGTCRGKQEPSYFTRVQHYMESFILKHVPRNETCIINTYH